MGFFAVCTALMTPDVIWPNFAWMTNPLFSRCCNCTMEQLKGKKLRFKILWYRRHPQHLIYTQLLNYLGMWASKCHRLMQLLNWGCNNRRRTRAYLTCALSWPDTALPVNDRLFQGRMTLQIARQRATSQRPCSHQDFVLTSTGP